MISTGKVKVLTTSVEFQNAGIMYEWADRGKWMTLYVKSVDWRGHKNNRLFRTLWHNKTLP